MRVCPTMICEALERAGLMNTRVVDAPTDTTANDMSGAGVPAGCMSGNSATSCELSHQGAPNGHIWPRWLHMVDCLTRLEQPPSQHS